ncbi:MAG: NAD-binding protein [Desulfuromonadales bacterium]|nr:NAD-binding protein [Desulfuromonadales bacterium]MDW7756799.1 NAD-binding protein [Desulfuromonadales bacterium]
MKTIASELAYFLRGRVVKNLKYLTYYCIFLAGMILLYAVLFRYLMWHLEGREFSLIAGIYWSITVMTTLGFGDITFHSDPGYIFAAVVTVSGVVFLLIILPFTLVSLFLAPWIEYRLSHRPDVDLPPETSGHVLIFGVDSVTRNLIRRLKTRQIPFVVVTEDATEAINLEDNGVKVVVGSPTDPEVLQGLRVAEARYIIANLSDPENVNLCLTARSLCETPIVALVSEAEHGDLLRLAGANQVIPLHKILGNYLATRATTKGAMAHVIDSFGKLVIAEIPVHGTPFSGLSLADSLIRQQTGLAVIGLWERGNLTLPAADTLLQDDALMVLAGTREQLESLEQLTGEQANDDLIFILGHGRVGCAAASFLDRKPVPFILVDRQENPYCEEHVPIYGDATVRHFLMKSGIDKARGLIVTTNDDNTNLFLTLASRHAHSHIRIVARATADENVAQFYAAGADFVVSSASVGGSILLNIIESKTSVFLTEGINIFRRPLPAALVGKSIAASHLRERTGCSIVALEVSGMADPVVVPSPETVLRKDDALILIGTPAQEEAFGKLFPK